MTPTWPDLAGFVTYNGIRITALGDDGDVLLAMGHHPARKAAKAFEAFVKGEWDWRNLADCSPHYNLADAGRALQQRWGVLLTDCGGCSGDRDCSTCREIKDGPWYIDYDAVYTAETPRAFPVTVLDI